MREEILIQTSKSQEQIDITSKINSFVKKSKFENGLCNVFVMHSSAAIIINENYDQSICLDLIDALDKIIPKGGFRHDKIDGNADAHIKSSILGADKTIPFENGRLKLGQWQSVMLFELDGPRERKIAITIIGD
ncbi:MAG TPA: secondary thiamine-phosphate synthase enzyme YjbQ [Candidatus Nanoarchaeia archaeon]|nr:secondary thiamine-phosphate synthase enzyme YjbQ [Candidatus Nanoarchaeia archaeon]